MISLMDQFGKWMTLNYNKKELKEGRGKMLPSNYFEKEKIWIKV